MLRRLVVTLLSLSLLASLTPAASGVAAPAALGLRARVVFPNTHDSGLAVLGSRYAYVGTSFSNNTLHIVGLPGLRRLANWHLPALSNGINYEMDRMAFSPNNRWLYMINGTRDDIVRLDVTGAQGPRRLNIYPQINGRPIDIKVSPDGARLYALGGRGADVYDARTGNYTGRIAGASAVAPARSGAVYYLVIGRGYAQVHVLQANGARRMLASYRGNTLSDLNGDIALSPNGRIVYALWDSFRAFDASSGRALGTVPLPLVPHFQGVTVAPNGQQAVLWAQSYAGVFDTPGLNPGYVRRHYGFVAGGVVAINLARMRPLVANLQTITRPIQAAYTSDSRLALVSTPHELDVIASGTAGVDRAAYPRVSLRGPGSGTSSRPPSSGNGAKRCTSWDISGSWTFVAGGAAVIGSGQAILLQSGSSLSGTLRAGGVNWTLRGTIYGRTVTLALNAPGQVQITYRGTVGTAGRKITGDLGTFSGRQARCIR